MIEYINRLLILSEIMMLQHHMIYQFNLQLCIDSIDRLLWRMVVLLTRSVSEAQKQISIGSISHQRKLQCLYTLCVIFFNTNRTCSVPMHLLLTDLVEAHGGSSELIRLLNYVDSIASADTHQHYVQFQIERKHRNGILSELNMTHFSVVSVDNIDFLQRHAFVYCVDYSQSWHEITVQVVQPLPLQTQCHSSKYVEDGSRERDTVLCRTISSNCSMTVGVTAPTRSQCKRTSHPTPECSPSTRSPKVKKVSHRARTCKETGATHYLHTSCQSPRCELLSSFNLSSSPNVLKSISNNHYSTLRNNHTMDDFHILSTEEVDINGSCLS